MVKNILYYKFKILTKLLFILYHIISSSYAFPNKNTIEFKFQDVQLKKAINKLIKDYGLSIAYSDLLKNPLINVACKNCSEIEAINMIVSDGGLEWKKIEDQFIIYEKETDKSFSISGVVKDIEDNQIVMGYPAVPLKVFIKKNK